MKLITKITIPKYNPKITHSEKCLFIGSCFAENIGEKLLKNKFNVSVNPLGISYNPVSLINSLSYAIENRKIEESELFFSNGQWNHYNFHSNFSDSNKYTCLNEINSSIERTNHFISSADYIFISLGTSFIYELAENQKIVTNCHKQPDSFFKRRMLNTEEITKSFDLFFQKMSKINPRAKYIFTVSPVRHKRDGFIANQLSKSILIVSLNDLLRKNENLSYFPSFEIMMDELRDYRFYNEDMVHPSNQAIDYIFEKFCETYFDEKTIELNKRIQRIVRAANHRPYNTKTTEYQQFTQSTIHEIEDIITNNPQLDFSKEKAMLKQNIN
ncbi:MAG: GSCFA domain-containing protein [Bacteroidales bacterium]|nr:GSCFA domain-containing protein [Bacteroidales bacterium]